jgi:ribosomal-protein-alanine N-acetyltransferase
VRERKQRKLLKKAIPFETDRLIIRSVEKKDVYDMYEYASLHEVCEFLLWSPHININATEGYIESLMKRSARGLYCDWAIELKEQSKMIGTCGYASMNSNENTCEIGYVLSPTYQGNGYMTEALNKLIKITFEDLGISKATLRIINENVRSKRLAEKLGFSLIEVVISDMVIKDISRDIAYYSMTDDYYFKNIKKEAE